MSGAAPSVHGQWSSRLVFILATVGFAVGLGNIWRFPYLAGVNGGGAFVLIYIFCVALIATPIIMAELLIGRRGRMTPVGSLQRLAVEAGQSEKWALAGFVPLLAILGISSFYMVIGGWTLDYAWKAITGSFAGVTPESAEAKFNALLANPGELILWQIVFIAINVAVVVRGLRGGIEKAALILMPVLILMLVGLAVYAMITGDARDGLAFLFQPDFSKVTAQTWVEALGQAFFSVSVGTAGLVVYGAYLPRHVHIPSSSGMIAAADTGVALLAGMAIFPFVFAYGMSPSAGPGLMFVAMPVALSGTAAPTLLTLLFFLLLAVAALTSSIAILETLVARAVERGWPRSKAVPAAAVLIFLLGLLTVFSFNAWAGIHPLAFLPGFETRTFFDSIDWVTSNLGLTLGGLTSALFAGWVMHKAATAEELGTSPQSGAFRLWRFLLRWPVPVTIVVLIIFAFLGSVSGG
ncbi:MAG: sodium-dependent transporter [Thermaurantiacus sp.]